MRRWLLGLVLAATCSGCMFTSGVGEPLHSMDDEPVGPRHEFGPVPRFTDEGREDGHLVVFFETRDGWCLESSQGGSCAGGDIGLPTEGFQGVSGSEGGDGTCMETIAAHDVVELRVETGDGRWVTLPPLAGGDAAPVQVFAACWSRGVRFDQLSVEARGADGEVIGTYDAG
ncbi:MAG: hypothetical protein KY461_09855 [Actinobacteria bacterium]|nr:hypothetical protein [Actinomycetota bacterium]